MSIGVKEIALLSTGEKRFAEHGESYFLFVEDLAIAPTNNVRSRTFGHWCWIGLSRRVFGARRAMNGMSVFRRGWNSGECHNSVLLFHILYVVFLDRQPTADGQPNNVSVVRVRSIGSVKSEIRCRLRTPAGMQPSWEVLAFPVLRGTQ